MNLPNNRSSDDPDAHARATWRREDTLEWHRRIPEARLLTLEAWLWGDR